MHELDAGLGQNGRERAVGSLPSWVVVAGWIQPWASYARSTCGRPNQSAGYRTWPGLRTGSAWMKTAPFSTYGESGSGGS